MASKVRLVTLRDDLNVEGVEIVSGLRGLKWDDVECLIYHSSTESGFDLTSELALIKEKVAKFIYANSEITPLIYGVFESLDADIHMDESLIEDIDTINYIVDEYKETGMAVKQATDNIETLNKLVKTLGSNDLIAVQKAMSNKNWVDTVSTSVMNIEKAIQTYVDANNEVLEVIGEARQVVDNLSITQEQTGIELSNLKGMMNELDRSARTTASIQYYPQYQVPLKVQRVVYIRAFSPCRYLNSFILAYQDYLKMQRQKPTKLLFIMPAQGKLIMQKYSHITRLSQDTVDVIEMAKENIFVTFEPKKAVFDKFFQQQNISLYIVVDLTYNDALLTGGNVKNMYAVGSPRDIITNKLPKNRTIMTTNKVKEVITIPKIEGYVQKASTEQVRKQLYYTHCKVDFEAIDKLAFSV